MAKEDKKDMKDQSALAKAGGGVSAMQNWSPEDLEKEGFSQEVIFSFQDVGERIRGKYVGSGAEITLTAKDDEGNAVNIPTWLVENGATTVRIIGKYELNQFFGGLPVGSEVAIIFEGMRSLPGPEPRQVRRFSKWAKRPDGSVVKPEPVQTNSGARQATA